jgi:lysine-specific permease
MDVMTSYWKDPGAFASGGIGTVSVLLSAGFSFLGTEIGMIME